eukprot:TRINITY_DN810_c0_g1_i1.p1 TRINITY_DN810_c0_g1~~TRINITY_DN810_c0_g1_i1.p1  ORF type:complete len:792 (-),score=155.94 TRINITY_DN810_c0_g1_i1:5-2326(-)
MASDRQGLYGDSLVRAWQHLHFEADLLQSTAHQHDVVNATSRVRNAHTTQALLSAAVMDLELKDSRGTGVVVDRNVLLDVYEAHATLLRSATDRSYRAKHAKSSGLLDIIFQDSSPEVRRGLYPDQQPSTHLFTALPGGSSPSGNSEFDHLLQGHTASSSLFHTSSRPPTPPHSPASENPSLLTNADCGDQAIGESNSYLHHPSMGGGTQQTSHFRRNGGNQPTRSSLATGIPQQDMAPRDTDQGFRQGADHFFPRGDSANRSSRSRQSHHVYNHQNKQTNDVRNSRGRPQLESSRCPSTTALPPSRRNVNANSSSSSSSSNSNNTNINNTGNNRGNKERGTNRASFVTAKKKLADDERKKNGGRPHQGRGTSYNNNNNNNSNNNYNYNHGNNSSKCDDDSNRNARRGKTLGGKRRGFVPPLKDTVERANEDARGGAKRAKYAGGGGSSRTDQDECSDGDQDPIFEDLKDIDKALVERVLAEIVDNSTPVVWDDIAGLKDAKNALLRSVILPIMRPDIFTGARAPPKGLLLFGPPGTGKTMIGKAIAHQANATFFSISASSLTSKWVGEGEKMVRALFAVARWKSVQLGKPSMIFIDEVDSLLTSRKDDESESSRKMKTEFFLRLDGIKSDPVARFLVIGATNLPQELDLAARRRFEVKLYIPLPEEEGRASLVERTLVSVRHNLTKADMLEVARLAKGFSGADMQTLVRNAAMSPLEEQDVESIMDVRVDEVRDISLDDFKKALGRTRPSVSQDELTQYVKWDAEFVSGNKQ